MPIIKVIKPFGLRLGSDHPPLYFGVSENFLSDDEFNHWFTQACIKEGRAVLVPETVAEDALGDSEGGDGEAAEPGVEGDVDNRPAAEAAAPDAEAEADVSDGSEKTGEQLTAPTREEFMALTVPQLREVATQRGVTVASNATKAVIVDALLAGMNGA